VTGVIPVIPVIPVLPVIPVIVVGGYLGSGKTTLLNHVLRSWTERIAVLVNDFGSINIDRALITTASDRMITLENGCICCSMADGLAVALTQVTALSPLPDLLVIEASGVGDPGSIARAVHGAQLRVVMSLTVADAETVRAKVRDRFVGDVVTQQLRAADFIVLNKTDLVSDEQLTDVRTLLGEIAPLTPVLPAIHGEVPLQFLLAAETSRLGATRGLSSAEDLQASALVPAEQRFMTWSAEAEGAVNVTRLATQIREMPPSLVRVKGVVRDICTGHRVIIQRVGTRLEIEDAGAWIGGPSQLVAIALRATYNGSDPLLGLFEENEISDRL
jgi:G3E family GTPase